MSAASDGAEVPVICGPTAAGKSTIALDLAQRHGRAILVADSRQVYRGFDVGTAKPDARERSLAAHFGIDLVDPTERYSAARWAAYADEVITVGVAEGLPPIVVGGTGMYLRALFDGLFAEPELDETRRAALEVWLDSRSTDDLRRWVAELDPPRAELGRTQLVRALIVALLAGEPISRLHETRASSTRWRPRYLVVDPGAALAARIGERLDAMLAAGWLDEVRTLDALPDDAPAWKSTGYRALREVLRGRTTVNEARERMLIETRQYAKRQRTWFRHQLPDERTTRVDPFAADAAGQIASWWEGVAR